MTQQQDATRDALNAQRSDGAQRTATVPVPLMIRDLDGALRNGLNQWVHERLGRQLGKYAPRVEQIEVRFGDENGPKGGVARNCMIHVTLSALPPVVVEMRGATDREAFDLAAGRAERATKRSLQKHGFTTNHKRRHREPRGTIDGQATMMPLDDGLNPHAMEAAPIDGEDDASPSNVEDSLFGRREGRNPEQLALVQARPEKKARDAWVDTSQPGTGADMRKAGYGHTAKRNTKLNTAGMSYSLEDSTTGKPSRKSTRRSKNRVKPANGLTVRHKAAVHSPQAHHARAR